MYATCCDCGEGFWREDAERWKRRCFSCWKADKAAKENARQDRAANENNHRNHTCDERELEAWYRRGYEAGHAAAIALGEGPPPPFDKTRLRELLQLCHPDKHGGSELANKVTQWLAEIKRGVRA